VLTGDHPLTVTEICQETDLPQSTVSRHLTVLRRVGVMVSWRYGITKVFEITGNKIFGVCDLVRSGLIEQIQKRSQIFD
jgi:DNA-binding transcriptional ArsR family regulator